MPSDFRNRRDYRLRFAGKVMNRELEDELFLRPNLYPRTTGLPMVIWIGPRYGAAHDARIEVSMTHRRRMDPGNLAVVAVGPRTHLVAGRLSATDLRAVSDWMALNEPATLDHWNELIDGT
jgi:hypothetical protein